MTDTDPAAQRKELVQGLQEDLAREYKAIIQYVIYSQVLDGAEYMPIAKELEVHAHEELDHAIAIAKQLDYFGAYPTEKPKPVEVPKDAKGMLWADLRAVRSRPDVEQVIRAWQLELLEKDVRELGVVVLPRVGDDLLDLTLAQRGRHGPGLDELWPVADDGQDLHGPDPTT